MCNQHVRRLHITKNTYTITYLLDIPGSYKSYILKLIRRVRKSDELARPSYQNFKTRDFTLRNITNDVVAGMGNQYMYARVWLALHALSIL